MECHTTKQLKYCAHSTPCNMAQKCLASNELSMRTSSDVEYFNIDGAYLWFYFSNITTIVKSLTLGKLYFSEHQV